MTQTSPLRSSVAGVAREPPSEGLGAGYHTPGLALWFLEAPTLAEPMRLVVVACSHIAHCFAAILQALVWPG